MSIHMMGSGLGAGSDGSPSLRSMCHLPMHPGAGGQQGKDVQEGIGGLRIQGGR